MFRDDRDALEYRADSLEQKVKEKSQEVETLQQQKERTEQENKQLKKKLSQASYGGKPPLWATKTFAAVALASVVLIGGALTFLGLRAAQPRTELTWNATLKTNPGVMIAPGTSCKVSGKFWISGEKTNVESFEIVCGGQIVKNTVYPFGGEGWRLVEEQRDASFVYQLQQATGDFRVDTSTQQASLYNKNNNAELVASFEIDTWSNLRRGASLFSGEKH